MKPEVISLIKHLQLQQNFPFDCSFYLPWIILQNELAILEFIHLLVETMDRHFGNVVSLAVDF